MRAVRRRIKDRGLGTQPVEALAKIAPAAGLARQPAKEAAPRASSPEHRIERPVHHPAADARAVHGVGVTGGPARTAVERQRVRPPVAKLRAERLEIVFQQLDPRGLSGAGARYAERTVGVSHGRQRAGMEAVKPGQQAGVAGPVEQSGQEIDEHGRAVRFLMRGLRVFTQNPPQASAFGPWTLLNRVRHEEPNASNRTEPQRFIGETWGSPACVTPPIW